MSLPVTVVLELSDAGWLRAMMDQSMWPGVRSEAVTRVRVALAHALATPDDGGAHEMVAQDRIGAGEFWES